MIMAIKYEKEKKRQQNIVYTIVTAILLCVVFIGMVSYMYNKTHKEEFENLHVQTKQIKDDIVLQLISDRENLSTMANFAAKLYKDGDDYSLLFESFKSIGMIENIGILNPDNTISSKAGKSDVNDKISFEEEKEKGVYISGLVDDITNPNYKLIRSAVPIQVDGQVVGILYGVIKPEKLVEKYRRMVNELDGQLFVYEKESGNILIDSIQTRNKNISFLKYREYNEGYSFEEFISTDKGYTSFQSAYRHESLLLHYSTIEEFDWMIAFGRYDSQVFAGTNSMIDIMVYMLLLMFVIIVLYILLLMDRERKLNSVNECASNVRKELLETTDGQNNIEDALREVCEFAKARSAVFFDTDGEFYHYISPKYEEVMLSEKEKLYFRRGLLRYAIDLYKANRNTVNVMCIKSNENMKITNPEFYKFLKEHGIDEVSLSSTVNKSNHITILAAVNCKRGKLLRVLAEKVSACFSIAVFNKKQLNSTIIASVTDAMTATWNRKAYNQDIETIANENNTNFACVYVDVNELHICNSKYGHAAGDRMLLFIANTLKDVFYGHKVYRMGGDEFLVFCRNVPQVQVEINIGLVCEQLKPHNYHVAIGMSYRSQNINIKEMVKEAEVRMYEEKAQYYQRKESKREEVYTEEYVQLNTGIPEVDTMLSVLKEKYNGIYRVSLSTDKAKRILMPAYLQYKENEEHFSDLYTKYVAEMVHPDWHRAVLSFLNYDSIKKQLGDNETPKIIYQKNNGESVALSVYKLSEENNEGYDTLWVFAKE